jgi:hypothetical protein
MYYNTYNGGNNMDTTQIAMTIFQQMKTLTPAPVMMSWGASKFQAVRENQIKGVNEDYLGGLLFYVRGMKHKGHVFITLSLNDTYTVSIGHVKKGVINPKKQINEVYFDQLGEIIDELIERQAEYAF